MKIKLICIIAILNFVWNTLSAQTNDVKNVRLNLFLNCGDCFYEYVQSELKFVNYVRDRKDAEIDLLVVTQISGLGDQDFILYFIGSGKFIGKDDTLKYFSKANTPEDIKRKMFVSILKAGLLRYISQTDLIYNFDINFTESESTDTFVTKDKWNKWLFDISGNADINGERTSFIQSYSASFKGDRTTNDLKVDFGCYLNSGINKYYFDEDEIVSDTKSRSVYFQSVKSLNRHWSAGLFTDAASSTYSNEKSRISLAPALEYNLFPYSQSQRKLFTLSWYLAYSHNEYLETTIYEKLNDDLFQNRLNLTLSIIQPWGSAQFNMFASQYLNDFSKNHFSFFANASLNIIKGLSFNTFFGYEIVHDQIFLPKGEETKEELLLHRKEIATSYFFIFNTGITYSFGSKFNSAVNQRLISGY